MFNFVIKQQLDIDAKDYQGFTAFFKIFKNRVKYQPKILETLLKKGVNIDISNEEGYTPFLFTFRAQEYDKAKMLVEYGADINHVSKDGFFALKYAV